MKKVQMFLFAVGEGLIFLKPKRASVCWTAYQTRNIILSQPYTKKELRKEVKKIEEFAQELRFIFGKGPRWHAMTAFMIGSVAIVTLVLAVVSVAINNALGLGGAGNWFLLSIALFLWGLSVGTGLLIQLRPQRIFQVWL